MALKLDMLRVFQTVAEEGALAPAADRLGRSASAVSMMLSQLEQEVGAPLFETDRKSRLTPLGRLVLEECRRANSAFARSVAAIRQHAASGSGTLRVASVPSATLTLLPPVIAAFRSRHPDARLEISDAGSASILNDLRQDAADIGIVSDVADSGEGLDATEIVRDELGIVTGRSSRLAATVSAHGTVSWADLATGSLIANPLCELVPHPAMHNLVQNGTLWARNTTTLLTFVQAGLGATVLPRGAIPRDHAGLVFLRPDDPPVFRTLRMVVSATRRATELQDSFAALLQAAGPAGRVQS